MDTYPIRRAENLHDGVPRLERKLKTMVEGPIHGIQRRAHKAEGRLAWRMSANHSTHGQHDTSRQRDLGTDNDKPRARYAAIGSRPSTGAEDGSIGPNLTSCIVSYHIQYYTSQTSRLSWVVSISPEHVSHVSVMIKRAVSLFCRKKKKG